MLLKLNLDHITIRWAWASERGTGDFEGLHFPIKFLAKKVVFLVSRGKTKFHNF